MLVFLWSFFFSVNAQTIIGNAYVNGQLTYIEKHSPSLKSDGSYRLLKTDYVLPKSNQVFAEIVSDFEKNLYVPESTFKDFRINLIETTKIVDSKKLFIRRQEKEKSVEDFLPIESSMVSGQGFHNFIVINFEQLLKEPKNISIVVTSKFDYFKFNIEKITEKENLVSFKITPSNILLRQVVKPIFLEYSKKEKELLSFKGLSNLTDEKGDSLYVEIFYRKNS